MNLQMMRLRRAAGFKSRRDFAMALGVPERRIKAWETQEATMSFEQASQVADLLGCSLDALAGRWEYLNEDIEGVDDVARCYYSLDEASRAIAAKLMAGIATGTSVAKITEDYAALSDADKIAAAGAIHGIRVATSAGKSEEDE